MTQNPRRKKESRKTKLKNKKAEKQTKIEKK